MTVVEKNKTAGVELDRRVRSRLLASGALDAGVVGEYLAGLPDLEAHAEIISVEQPALGSAHARLDADVDADADDEGFE